MAKASVLPTRKSPSLAQVQARFRSWRKGKKPGDRIPPRLWTVAVEACESHSLCEVSRTLGLNHSDLKRRWADWKGEPPFGGGFVELSLPASPCSCIVELTQASGTTLKMTFQGQVSLPDPVVLIRAFRSQNS
jgi:hypothetical protein